MSSKLNDGTNPFLFEHSISPNSYAESQSGRTIDLIDGDGPCVAIVSLVVLNATDPIAIEIEESSDGTAWSAVDSASPIEVSDPIDGVQTRTFQRTERYVRTNLSTTINNDLYAAVVIGQQKKTM